LDTLNEDAEAVPERTKEVPILLLILGLIRDGPVCSTKVVPVPVEEDILVPVPLINTGPN
jgi:hypothetical protein